MILAAIKRETGTNRMEDLALGFGFLYVGYRVAQQIAKKRPIYDKQVWRSWGTEP